jgi:sugar fermentation stimulation protein A
MKFDLPMREGKLLKRYKRFFADVELDGKTIVALVANTGSMKGCSDPQSVCRVSLSDNPERKIPYTLEMVKAPDSWVGVNTSRPNKLVRELWESRRFSPWSGFDRLQGEVKISDKSRIDFVLWNSKKFAGEKLVKPDFKKLKGPFHFVEVKNVSLAEKGMALFPDSVTLRGQKHIDELVRLTEQGHTAELLFVIQRTDCESFSPADDIDPEYGRKLRAAVKAGVKITPLRCRLSHEEIVLGHDPLPLGF